MKNEKKSFEAEPNKDLIIQEIISSLQAEDYELIIDDNNYQSINDLVADYVKAAFNTGRYKNDFNRLKFIVKDAIIADGGYVRIKEVQLHQVHQDGVSVPNNMNTGEKAA